MKKKNTLLRKYKEKVEKSQKDTLKKKSQVKSNRILPKYHPPEIQTEYSKKSLECNSKPIFGSFQGEKLTGVKVQHTPSEGTKMTKHKSISQKRLNDSIFKSLNEIKKSLRKKSHEKHSFNLEKPLCDSNKTKATFTESPNHSFPLEVELVLTVYDDKLSKLEKVELKDYKEKDPKFLIYYLGGIPARTTNPPDEEFDDERGDYIAEKGSNIYFRYEILDHIGKGSFGKVYKAYDHKEKKETALKILRSFPKDKSQIDLEPEILMYMKNA